MLRYTNKRRYWQDIKNQREYMDWVAQQLGVTNPEDWYKVSSQQVIKQGGGVINAYNNSLYKGYNIVS